MGVRTSANFYRRGIPNSYSNFALVSQSNFNVVNPINKFIANTNFFNRNFTSFYRIKK
jgi:hypothetical protein